MAQFEIKVLELDSGGKQYDFPIPASWLDRALREDQPEGATALKADPNAPEGTVSVWAEKSGEDVVVRGRVRAHLVAECARCLADASIDVDAELATLFSARGERFRVAPADEDLSPEEIERESYSGDLVVLDPLVREHVLLEVPMQPLCSEACPGVEVPETVRGPASLEDAADAPTHEGKRVDPRLAPLLGMLNDSKKKQGS